jgi:hypothetical protein
MPITYPAQQVTDSDSWMVSGFPAMTDAPEKIVAPASMEHLLPSDFESVQARHLLNRDERHEPVSKWIVAEHRKVNEVFPEFFEIQPVDVVCYGTQILDGICHRAVPYPRSPYAVLRRLYSAARSHLGWSVQTPRIATIARRNEVQLAYHQVDTILSSLIDMTDPDRILLVSDHGFKLDGRGHAFVGTSLTDGPVRRPEHIAEVPEPIYESLGIKHDADDDTTVDRENGQLSDDEREKVQEQMASLGYLDG